MIKLMDNSIRISGVIRVHWPQYDCDEELDMTEIGSKFNGCFATNNSTICFVYNGEIFVTPWTREAIVILYEEGFVEKNFYVPFSNWDFPINERGKWSRLCESARKNYEDYYEDDCKTWCDKHHIGELSDDILSRCIRIPKDGVPIKHTYYEDICHPACHEISMDSSVTEKLGHYCFNNGKVVFVYRDGHTYVTKGYKIIDELRAAGYCEAAMFVPFSNGEIIIDRDLRSRWDAIKTR